MNTVIKIEPSDNLFRELGNNTYDFVDLISEFIDNSIAAKIEIVYKYGFKNQKINYKIYDNKRFN
ncbi:hypothetical protein C4097_03765 [Clostridioides difficile]|uniref:hypothetical protein n=1 Tax=Bacillota TaxID=1239 RepID=UPI001C2A2B25|nr:MULTISPECIES: hypothetical protein [Bacillota]MDB3083674.1 hypothetical protein [Clostridioides difficile]MBZ6007575.1 hypothetical protein [Paraclostridium bifermentans]MDU0296619.1 hypothetical protein [Paraclostridium sp. MRS3W1]UOW69757.1 hypothetical protein MTR78_17610 [Paraclostridium bifermentans]GJG92701.1 hypothetical protein EFL1_28410 [Enterococcus faecium]